MEEANQSERSSYRKIMKATTLFGGLQVYTILIQVIRSKVIAVLLGPEGVGIEGLFKSAIELVQSVTGLGLANSAVRDVADANGTQDLDKISKTVHSVRKLVRITGLLGLICFAILSPWLSKFSFGNTDYSLSFVLLSIVLFFDQLCAGQKVVLQGLSKYKHLAKATALGTTFGLFVSIPFYYFLGVKGIVPTLILNSLCAMLLSWYFSSKITIKAVDVDTKQALSESKSMIKMGLSICLSTAEASLIAYLLRSFIRLEGGVESVGLFQAGYTLVVAYVGLVFSAMSTDFYPRLANVNRDNNQCRVIINEQGVVASCLLAPIIVGFISFLPIIVSILYTNEFQSIQGYIAWASIGMMFRLSSWIVSFLFLAKGAARLFIINETVTKIYFFALNILGYKYGGLNGLGIAFLVSYVLYSIQVYLIAHKKYDFSFSFDFVKVFLIMAIFVIFTIAVGELPLFYRYSVGFSLFMICAFTSYKVLNKRMDISSLIKSKLTPKNRE